MATKRTTIPIPPIQWRRTLHKWVALERDSMSEMTVAPVVVRPEMASKVEELKVCKLPSNKKGRPLSIPSSHPTKGDNSKGIFPGYGDVF